MSPHKKCLKTILGKSDEAFKEWLVTLTDEELDYVESLLELAEDSLDQILLEQSGLEDAQYFLKKIAKKSAD